MNALDNKDLDQLREQIQLMDKYFVSKESISSEAYPTYTEFDETNLLIEGFIKGIYKLVNGMEGATVTITVAGGQNKRRKVEAMIRSENTQENWDILEQLSSGRGYVAKNIYDHKSHLVCNIIYGRDSIEPGK